MPSARRPLLTATAAGTLLCALWFVPSANASQDAPASEAATSSAPARITQVTQARAMTEATDGTADRAAGETELADTGSFDTTPYVVGGSLFLAVGAGFVVYSVRRERLGF
ncbi:LAETG motif-containing sortase-dependent surface protein [Streptomyces sp. NPDC046727]|uniref:LAETG motif-containing sortase-dependent surface protein n=1 Tax=Streptomyces sp. NPDC046727 TaxID=3155373 RepID=UPI0033C9F3F2